MLVKIYTENPSEKEIDRVVNLLERDGVVIYPTDSVYAFGCSIRSAKAVERLRRIKGKDLTTFSVVFDSLGRIADYCRVDNAQFRLLKQNLPGPFILATVWASIWGNLIVGLVLGLILAGILARAPRPFGPQSEE